MARVEIYSSMFCPFCFQAKRLLDSKGADVQEIDVTMNSGLRRQMMDRAGGRSSVPQIFIGDLHVGGCDELYALDAEGRLDPLLSGEP
jgi:glutaredoxin 3